MEQKVLTPKQHHFLECICQEPTILKNFYLTGGTALAAFYYQHRLSEDIDLFCEEREVDQKLVETFLKKVGPALKVRQIKRSVFLGLVSYLLHYTDGQALKVDFNFYPFPRIEKGTYYKKLAVDSVYDIAANKVHTLFMKPRTRDYIDLYFILKKEKYLLSKLIIDAKSKFDWDIDRPTLGSQLMRVKDLTMGDLPKMLVPFHKKDMEAFFLELAKSLEHQIFKN